MPADLRLAWRALRAAPGYALAAALTLALGIGAATSIFSVVDAVLLRPLPYRDPARVVVLWSHRSGPGGDPAGEMPPSAPDVADWSAALAGPGRPFAGVAFSRSEGLRLRTPDGAVGLNAAAVSPGFFQTLGGRVLIGRTPRPDEETPGAPRVAVLTHRTWRQRFGGDPGVVGRTVAFVEGPVTIVGVMPPGYEYPGRWAELWTPLASTAAADPGARARVERRDLRSDSRVIARLSPGVTPEAAGAALATAAARLAAEHPAEDRGWSAHVDGVLRDAITAPVRRQLLVLLGAVGLLLLIACADVANLALVRASVRGPDLAVRRALGASPVALARQLLTESALVAVAGGALGALLAVGGSALLRTGAPELPLATAIPRFETAGVDARVLAFAVAAAALTAVLFGVAPALRAARTDAAGALRGGARGAARAGVGRRFRDGVVVAQLATTFVLLVGGALLGRSFLALRAQDAGFPVEQLVAVPLHPPSGPRYEAPEAKAALYARVREAAARIPGVQAAGVVNHLALTGAGVPTDVRVPGVAVGGAADSIIATFRVADGHYFAASGTPIRRGRALDESDLARAERPGATGVPVVVTEALARQAFGTRDPLGRSIRVFRQAAGRADFHTPIDGVVVGVARGVKEGALDDTIPEVAVYVPMSANPWPWATLVVRARGGDPAALVPAVRRAVAAVDPDLPLDDLRTGASLVGFATAEQRFTAGLAVAFATAATLLAAVGLYGVVAYGAAQRVGELGVRAALGATRGALVRLVVGDGARLAAAGVALGTFSALALSRVVASLLFGVGARDGATYAGGAGLLAGVALLASWLPARRAARVDPVAALRGE